MSPTGDSSGLLTKTYVIPPRPKPGRKPATDTPQTKRKEQNREAQRAFRERRAARVGELEDELADRVKAWKEREASLEEALRNQHTSFQSQLDALRSQHQDLEYAFDQERRLRIRLENECQALRTQTSRYSAGSMTSYGSGGSTPWSRRAVSPVAQEKFDHRTSRSLPTSRTDNSRQPANSDAFDPDCRRCENGGTCACLEQRLASVTSARAPKTYAEPMEIDFTTTLTKDSSNAGHQAPNTEYAPHDVGPTSDSCGFCTDNQNCVCRTYDEPPKAVKLPSITGPGSCDKCQVDPERARFCKMLANAPPLGGPPTANPNNRRLPSIDEKMAMSCDEAYDTLSKEPAFKDRRNSISFINQFRARPTSPMQRNTDNPVQLAHASALEVDIAGVLAGLRAERNREMEGRR